MFIQTEDTPNPNTVKFLMPELLLENDSISLTRGSKELKAFPVAMHLFDLEEVLGIFICNNFISVSKEESASWESLKTLVLSKLLDLASQKIAMVNHEILSVMLKSKAESDEANNASSGDDLTDSIIKQIKELLETRVRPAVAQDGGNIVYHDFKDGTVYLELQGACANCPSSTVTLKNGIENMLKHYIPEVQAVEAI